MKDVYPRLLLNPRPVIVIPFDDIAFFGLLNEVFRDNPSMRVNRA